MYRNVYYYVEENIVFCIRTYTRMGEVRRFLLILFEKKNTIIHMHTFSRTKKTKKLIHNIIIIHVKNV